MVPALLFGEHRFLDNTWSFLCPFIHLHPSNIFLWVREAKIYRCSPDITARLSPDLRQGGRLSAPPPTLTIPLFLPLKSCESILFSLPDTTHSAWHLHAFSWTTAAATKLTFTKAFYIYYKYSSFKNKNMIMPLFCSKMSISLNCLLNIIKASEPHGLTICVLFLLFIIFPLARISFLPPSET